MIHKIPLPVAEDLARIIKNGEDVFKNSDVLTKNVYSYTEPDQPFANHHWLSGVVFYLLNQTVGFTGIVIFKVILLLSAFSLLFWLALKKADFWLVAFFSIPTIIILSGRSSTRPEIFSYFFIVLFLYFLFDLEEHPNHKRIWWLIPAQLLWVNLHLFFGIGILLVGGFMIEKIIVNYKNLWNNKIIKKLAMLLGALVLVSMINPYGPKGALFALRLNVLKDFPITISENRSAFELFTLQPIAFDMPVVVFMIMTVFLGISFIVSIKRKPIFYFLAGVGTTVLGFSVIRSQALFGLILLPAISTNFSTIFEKSKRYLNTHFYYIHIFKQALMVTLIIIIFYLMIWGRDITSYREQFGLGLTTYANSSAEFFKANDLKGPIFNDADIGSYLIYHLYPKEKVFVDNRFGDAYSPEFFKDTYQAMILDQAKWQEMVQKYNFNAIYFYHYDNIVGGRRFLYTRTHDPAWVLVYADPYAVIFLRNNLENQKIINAFKITAENAEQKLNHLVTSSHVFDQIAAGDLFNIIGREDLAMNTYFDIVREHPKQGIIWMILGQMELGQKTQSNPKRALVYLDNALRVGWKTPEVYSYIALAYFRMGNFKEAEAAVKKELDINPESPDGKEWLNILNVAKNAQ
ncbi:hypothetical protein KW782_01455 [Candidatus Parcubacteria bacterium]|nr:hypothetical protein [Candidatus Parcubacteria bacterium]